MQDLGIREPLFLAHVAETKNTEELGVGMHVVRYQPTTQAQELATERRFVTNFAYISWFHPLMQDLGTREPPFLVSSSYN